MGWNNKYDFTENDLRISCLQLKEFVDKGENIQFEALWYLTCHCNYGGKVTDDRDRRCLLITLHTYYNHDLVDNPDHKLGGSDIFKIPLQDSFEDFTNYIHNMPLQVDPGVYGFHSNASITKEINETNVLLAALIDTRGTGSGGGGGNDKIVKFIDGILEGFPANFNTKEVRTKFEPSRDESLNTVNYLF